MQRPLSHFRYLTTVGFQVARQIEFERLLKMAFESGATIPLVNGKYYLWEPGGGIQIWVKVKDRVVLACAPHYSGEGAMRASIEGFYARPPEISVTEGAFVGTALPADSESAGFPLVVDVPGFEAVASRVVPPQTRTVQIAAFAREMTCFPTVEAFAQWQRTAKNAPISESFVFAEAPLTGTVSSGPAPAEAVITAQVLKAGLQINPITQQNFIVLLVRTPDGSTVDVVAHQQVASGELLAGGIIRGTFWLSGSILESTSPSESAAPTVQIKAPMLSRLTGWVRGGNS